MSKLLIDLTKFDKVCSHIPSFLFGRKSNVFIVGGAARYITGKESSYTDIDIAIEVTSLANFECIIDELKCRYYITSDSELSTSEYSMACGADIENHCATEPPESDRYYFDDHKMSGYKFIRLGKKIDIFAVKSIRKYIKTVPTAWDGIALYLKNSNHYIHSNEYLSDNNHMITSRPMYLFNPSHIERQGLTYDPTQHTICGI